MKILNKYLFFTVFTFPIFNAFSWDAPLFYRALPFWGEPRIAMPRLTSLDLYLNGGFTLDSRNNCAQCVPLLDIYGPQNINALGLGVPNLDANNPLDKIILDLASLPETNFLSFAGRFSIFEINLVWTQNLPHGLFAELDIPIRRLTISNIRFKNLASPGILETTPELQNFINNFDNILEKFSLSRKDVLKFYTGNIALFLGWTINYDKTLDLDFVDFSAKTGVLLPTASQSGSNKIFDLSTGYDGSYGVPLVFDFSIGALEWLTYGIHVSNVFLTSQTKCMRIKTAFEQSGFIKLTKDIIKINKGSIWDIGTYLKADHFVFGLSVALGYTYIRKNQDHAISCTKQFDNNIINSDPVFAPWSMHVLHLLAEYDFANFENTSMPKIGLGYNKLITGRNIFRTSLTSGYIGMNLHWEY